MSTSPESTNRTERPTTALADDLDPFDYSQRVPAEPADTESTPAHGTPADESDKTIGPHNIRDAAVRPWVIVPVGTDPAKIAATDIGTVTYRFDEHNAVAFLVHESIMANPESELAFDRMVIDAYPELLAADAQRPQPKPQIIVTNLQLDEQTERTLDALYAKNKPPKLFVRSAEIVRVRPNENKRPVVEKVIDSHLRMYMTKSADFYRMTKHKVATSPPMQIATNILALEKWEFPALSSVVEIPVLRPDGSIIDKPGYDTATGVYYWPDEQLQVPPISNNPSRDEINAAVNLIHEAIGEFPYVDRASYANAVALLLTPLVRQAIEGAVPIGLIDAVGQGTGKSLLSDVISLIPTGRTAAMMTMAGSEEEWRKRITSTLYEGATLMFIDNISGRLDSETLASALTSWTWKDRWLGVNKTIEVPNRATWIGNGNNIQLGGDMQRRAFWIRMDAKSSTPWMGRKFRHPELIPWVHEQRGRLIAAFLTLVRAWYVAKCQPSSIKPLGRFEEWTNVVTGVLTHAGIPGCLENLQAMYDIVDEESAEWERFLREIHSHFGDDSFTTADAVSDAIPALADALPEELASVWNSERDAFNKRLGAAFRSREERRYGAEQYRISRDGAVIHGAVAWCVRHGE